MLQDPADAEHVLRHGVGKHPIRRGFEYIHHYRMQQRKGEYQAPGLLSGQGEDWYKVRSSSQKVMLRPKSAQLYLKAMEEVTDDFIEHIREIRDLNMEMPPTFQNELYKWALELIGVI